MTNLMHNYVNIRFFFHYYNPLHVSSNSVLIISRSYCIDPLTPNDPYRGRTAPLTSKRCILYIYSRNMGTEYFKHGIYSSFFSLLFKIQFVS